MMLNSSTRLRTALSCLYCSYKERIKERVKMRKGLTITNDHGWTVEQLQAHEKTIKKATMAKRVAVIRLIMQGYYAIQVAELLNVHRETISSYVKKFNHGGMEALIHRDYSPGKPPFLSP